MKNDCVTVTTLCLLGSLSLASAFVTGPSSSRIFFSSAYLNTGCRSSSSTTDEFAAFAASLEVEEEAGAPQTTKSSTASKAKTSEKNKNKSWQDDLDKLLDPTTPFTKRQILLQDLLSANEDIRSAVEAALRDRKVRTWLAR